VTCVVEVGVSLLRRISGQVILVISGRGRMMYQCLQPEPEGVILPKRSAPQEVNSSPHDAGASMANWLETNIQGGDEALRTGMLGRRTERGVVGRAPPGATSQTDVPTSIE
jgi:hypothetical protein